MRPYVNISELLDIMRNEHKTNPSTMSGSRGYCFSKNASGEWMNAAGIIVTCNVSTSLELPLVPPRHDIQMAHSLIDEHADPKEQVLAIGAVGTYDVFTYKSDDGITSIGIVLAEDAEEFFHSVCNRSRVEALACDYLPSTPKKSAFKPKLVKGGK